MSTTTRTRPLLWVCVAGGASVATMFMVIIAVVGVDLANQQPPCGTQTAAGQGTTAISTAGAAEIPAQLVPLYQGGAARYQLGADGWAYLAAINRIESDFGRNPAASTAGAVGPMQFLPSTFATYGVAVGHRGAPDINRPADAIYAAANYLHASGAPADWGKAIFAYNHAGWYVDDVTRHAHEYAAAPAGSDTPVALQPVSPAAQSNTALGADTVLWTQRGAATTYGWDPVTHYVDPNDANNPSLPGATNDIAGISLLRQDTKGGWFRITAPNHITAVLQQTDYGPSTSALIDINAVAARIVFHYPEGNAFPSYAGTWTVSYLGMRRPPDAATPEQGFGLHPNPQLAAANTTTAGGGCPAPNCGPGAQTPNPLAAQTPFGALPDPGGNAVPDEHGGDGFTPGPGTDYTVGQEPQLARRLDALGRALHLKLTGISGYRTPQHSVSVGGFADDPHTRGQASDTPGIQGVAEATLNRFGLTRPFPGASEADHIQLQNGGNGAGAVPAGAAAAATPIACQNAGAAPTIC